MIEIFIKKFHYAKMPLAHFFKTTRDITRWRGPLPLDDKRTNVCNIRIFASNRDLVQRQRAHLHTLARSISHCGADVSLRDTYVIQGSRADKGSIRGVLIGRCLCQLSSVMHIGRQTRVCVNR